MTYLERLGGDILGGRPLRAADARRDHVRLEQDTLEIYVVVGERLEDERQDLLGDAAGGLDVVVSVRQHLGLNDRHQAVLRNTGTRLASELAIYVLVVPNAI